MNELADAELLEAAAPVAAWKAAFAQARRAPASRFGMGAAIWDPAARKVVATGCSHPSAMRLSSLRSVHAEHHALMRGAHLDLTGCVAVVVGLGMAGGLVSSSCPCQACASGMFARRLARAVYLTRQGQTVQAISETPGALLARALRPAGDYARQLRIPALRVV